MSGTPTPLISLAELQDRVPNVQYRTECSTISNDGYGQIEAIPSAVIALQRGPHISFDGLKKTLRVCTSARRPGAQPMRLLATAPPHAEIIQNSSFYEERAIE